MAQRGRKPSAIRRTRLEVPIDERILSKVDLFLTNPETGKPAYGARRALIERLLRQWLAQRGVSDLPEVEAPHGS